MDTIASWPITSGNIEEFDTKGNSQIPANTVGR